MPKFESLIADAHHSPRQQDAIDLFNIAIAQIDARGERVLDSWTPHKKLSDGDLRIVMHASCDLIPDANECGWNYPKGTSGSRLIVVVQFRFRTVLQVETTKRGRSAVICLFRRGKTWEQHLRSLAERDQDGQGAADNSENADTSSPADPDDDWVDPADERERLAAAASASASVPMNELGSDGLKPEVSNV